LLKSQHRRDKTNERERIRTRKINNAYDRLRELVSLRRGTAQKLSKIETLLVAKEYIEALNQTVHSEPRPAIAPGSGKSYIDECQRIRDDSLKRVLYSRIQRETATAPTHQQ
uniref:BHLH domain-containing protein n=1 Tax=Gongylonema pulchrum TaxID=637853 RepID=A0A183EF31_9BILA